MINDKTKTDNDNDSNTYDKNNNNNTNNISYQSYNRNVRPSKRKICFSSLPLPFLKILKFSFYFVNFHLKLFKRCLR